MNTWTVLKVCGSVFFSCFCICWTAVLICASKLSSGISTFKWLFCALLYTVAHPLLFSLTGDVLMSLYCSSPRWRRRGGARQQAVDWVFWPGWRSRRGLLIVWKQWNEGMKLQRYSMLCGSSQFSHMLWHHHVHAKCIRSEKYQVHRTCLAFDADGFCRYANLKWTSA